MNSAKALFLIKTIITLHNNFISRCRLLRGNKSWGSWVQQYTMSLRDTDEIIKTDSCNISLYVCVGVFKVIACLGTTNPVFCSFTSQVRPHRSKRGETHSLRHSHGCKNLWHLQQSRRHHLPPVFTFVTPAKSLVDERTERSRVVCSNASWLTWIFLCVKRNQTAKKS